MSDTRKFTTVETADNKPVSCSIVVGSKLATIHLAFWLKFAPTELLYFLTESGRIYHQGAVEIDRCTDEEHRLALDKNIAKQHKDPQAKIKVAFALPWKRYRDPLCPVLQCDWV